MQTLTLGELRSRMLREEIDKGINSSLYPIDFGYIIAPILLTQWPYGKKAKPLLFSQKHLAMRQLAALCQAMFIRCSLQNFKDAKEMTVSSIGSKDEQLEYINDRLLARMTRPVIYIPDTRGMKLNKTQVIAWARAYTLDALYLMANYHGKFYKDLIAHQTKWQQFLEEALFLRYSIACGDVNLLVKLDSVLQEGIHAFDVSWMQMDIIQEHHYLDYFDQQLLEAFYDYFIVYLTELDIYFTQKYRKGLSQMTPEELGEVRSDQFPRVDPLIKIVPAGGSNEDLRSSWRAEIDYEELNDCYVIKRIIAPENVIKNRMK